MVNAPVIVTFFRILDSICNATRANHLIGRPKCEAIRYDHTSLGFDGLNDPLR
jgi:hypothetical protein